MAKCPHDGSEMEKRKVEVVDQVVLDVCPKCDGIWMERGMLNKVSKDEVMELKISVVGDGMYRCPNCGREMQRSDFYGIKLNECQCGIYFEKGKVEKIIGKQLILKSQDDMHSIGLSVSQLMELVDKRRITADTHEIRVILEKDDEPDKKSAPAETKEQPPLRARIHNFFEKPRGKFAIGVQIFIIYLIILSVILTVAELFLAEKIQPYMGIVDLANKFILAVFTVEYVLRVATAPRKIHYITRPLNVIDLLAILPSIIEEAFHMTVEYETMGLRALRLLRLLRFARLIRALRLMQLSYKLMWID